jgi:hypothetical protein
MGSAAIKFSLFGLLFRGHGPVPVRVMLWGLVGSLLTVTAMLALSDDPPAVGVNVTAMVQVELAGAVLPQVPPLTVKSFALLPLKLSPTDSGKPDLLVIVTSLVLVEVLAVSVPYARVTGAIVSGIVGPVLSATV